MEELETIIKVLVKTEVLVELREVVVQIDLPELEFLDKVTMVEKLIYQTLVMIELEEAAVGKVV